MNEVLAITLLSLKISLTAVFLASIISVLTAYLICFRSFYGKRFAINLIHTFMGLPPVVVGLAMKLGVILILLSFFVNYALTVISSGHENE